MCGWSTLLFALLLILIDAVHRASAAPPHCVETLLEDGKYPAAKAYREAKSAKMVTDVAVYLLGSLTNAQELGVPVSSVNANKGGYVDYFARLVAAKATWAARVVHFYGVLGNGEAETQGLKKCTYVPPPVPSDPRNNTAAPQMYTCGVSGVSVLQLGKCDNSPHGATGPCCRCSGAMRHFLHHHHHVAWFIFSDDDYFVRMHLLDALLKPHSRTPTPIAVTTWGFGDHPTTGRSGFGFGVFNSNCSVECVHRFPWMGWGGFNKAAVTAFFSSSPSSSPDPLVGVCSRYSVTHDIGLALFTWMHSFSLLRVVEHLEANMVRVLKIDAWLKQPVLWHNHFDQTKMSFSAYLTKVASPGEDVNSFIAKEEQLGAQLAQALPFINNGGAFRNTIYARRMEVYNKVASSLDSGALRSPTGYLPSDCADDFQEFSRWRKTVATAKAAASDNKKECALYSEHMANLHVDVDIEEIVSKVR